eukprot:365186-Chlamydomonas_euryale.AAC.13
MVLTWGTVRYAVRTGTRERVTDVAVQSSSGGGMPVQVLGDALVCAAGRLDGSVTPGHASLKELP